MKLPRDLSSLRLADTLCSHWACAEVHQSGSPIILETDPSHQRLAVPAHKALRIGTLNAILRAVATHKATTRQAIIASL